LSLPNRPSGLLKNGAKTSQNIIDETGYHLEALECFGCHKEFSNTLRHPDMPDNHKYCGNCFFAVYGLKEYMIVCNENNEFFNIVWHTPVRDLPKEILKQIDWVDKNYAKRNGFL